MARFVWVKIAVEMPRDHKLYTRPLVDRHLWTCLLCHAQEHFPGGIIQGATAAALNSLFNLGGASKVEAALAYFASAGMVRREGDALILLNFEKRQAPSKDTPEAVRVRQQRYRDRHRDESGVTGKVTGDLPVTRSVTRNAEEEEEEEEEREEEKKQKQKPAAAALPLRLEPQEPPPPATPFVAFVAQHWPDVKEPHKRQVEWAASCPGVDLLAEARRALAYENESPANKKHDHGRYFGNWIRRSQERAGQTTARPGFRQQTAGIASATREQFLAAAKGNP